MIRFPLALPVLLLTAGVLTCLPARADDDRFVLRLGPIHVDGTARFDAAAQALGDDYRYSSGRLDFGKEIEPRVEGVLRLSDRNRLMFNHFRYKNGNSHVLDEDLIVEGNLLPAGTTAEARAKFDLGSIVYDYALAETPNVGFGAQIGLEWADLKGSVRTDNELIHLSASENVSGVAPVIGLRVTTASSSQKWGLTLQAQYLSTHWGNFDKYSGNISRANALAEYRFTKNVGIYAGYDWFRLNAKRNGTNGDIGINLHFKGPTAGVTLAF